MEHQSVYFLAHNMRYKNNKTIQDIKKLDEDIIESSVSSSINDYSTVYNKLNNDYIEKKNKNNIIKAKAINILYLVYRLRFAFEARVRQKNVCYLKIRHTPINTNGTINNMTLSPDQQFNLYLYIFNENSSVKIPNSYTYNSKLRKLINIALDVMKNYE